MEKGTVLFTKDGRRIGNGIILRKCKIFDTINAYRIKTDYGNVLTLTKNEINELFYVDENFDWNFYSGKSKDKNDEKTKTKVWLWNRFLKSFKTK